MTYTAADVCVKGKAVALKDAAHTRPRCTRDIEGPTCALTPVAERKTENVATITVDVFAIAVVENHSNKQLIMVYE